MKGRVIPVVRCAIALVIAGIPARAQAQGTIDATPVLDISGNAPGGAIDFELATRVMPVRQQARDGLLALPMPDALPPYTGIVADEAGLAWLTLAAPGDAHTRLRAVDAARRTDADVTIPRRISVHEVGGDYILGTYDDADDVPHIVVYRLRRGR